MISLSIKIPELKIGQLDLSKSPLKDKIHDVIRSQLSKQFSESGGSWAALAPATLKKPRKSSRPFDTISHKMWASFTYKNNAEHLFIAEKDFIEVGSDMPDIPVYQMEGTKTIPQRSIEATPLMADAVMELIADSLVGE